MSKTIEQMFQEKQKRIDRAISSREKSIAYFNGVNSAIRLQVGKKKFNWKRWENDRDRFIEKWQNWYLENMIQENKKDNNEVPL